MNSSVRAVPQSAQKREKGSRKEKKKKRGRGEKKKAKRNKDVLYDRATITRDETSGGNR
jgi:hypothetical protein